MTFGDEEALGVPSLSGSRASNWHSLKPQCEYTFVFIFGEFHSLSQTGADLECNERSMSLRDLLACRVAHRSKLMSIENKEKSLEQPMIEARQESTVVTSLAGVSQITPVLPTEPPIDLPTAPPVDLPPPSSSAVKKVFDWLKSKVDKQVSVNTSNLDPLDNAGLEGIPTWTVVFVALLPLVENILSPHDVFLLIRDYPPDGCNH